MQNKSPGKPTGNGLKVQLFFTITSGSHSAPEVAEWKKNIAEAFRAAAPAIDIIEAIDRAADAPRNPDGALQIDLINVICRHAALNRVREFALESRLRAIACDAWTEIRTRGHVTGFALLSPKGQA